jgi:hypothetical protein
MRRSQGARHSAARDFEQASRAWSIIGEDMAAANRIGCGAWMSCKVAIAYSGTFCFHATKAQSGSTMENLKKKTKKKKLSAPRTVSLDELVEQE